ncbi:hypothetical protein [Francisella adeliensis]|uniref:Phosphoadenosine phosphosulphate reductase domain-containing protein n=1 Tax=Francisella adeliensis TaxID=2007306 RepID=A0A2Z4XXF1_9GAMM|nr:hypothetical protein [Francisella adeliensis]AXA33577.1 hypothetical protein CDH04_03750 [Francisella adeliensis]MBK2084715.1 hypothetical protein [Francisella adeliensis]MBK2097342.1 hypothetical protein [Francisella adeliensis]QIW11809.1 hypothetical protein FZC43_03750 [Francisella adeliensis]QIW13685.1 hypothetical protein FZC44_03750 [Francisella adeliensis]
MNNSSKNFIIANYSIHSLALICWAKENLNNDFYVLSVDTGFASSDWSDYLEKVFNWLDKSNIKYSHLKSENSFQELVTARKQFPSQQFSWCAGFLKGITLLTEIDEIDPDCEATILLSHRKDLSLASSLLKNLDEEEKYDYRELKYPLLDKSFADIQQYISDLPFTPVFRSQECQPCIHFTKKEFETITTHDSQKIIQLEQENQTFMFGSESFANSKDNFLDKDNIMLELSKACSWEYSCGL